MSILPYYLLTHFLYAVQYIAAMNNERLGHILTAELSASFQSPDLYLTGWRDKNRPLPSDTEPVELYLPVPTWFAD